MDNSLDAADDSPNLNVDRAIHAGLRAAFESVSNSELDDSVVRTIERRDSVHPSVLLRDPFGGADTVLSASSEEAEDGEKFGRRYEIHGELAKGGIGVILKGRDADLGREVAIKVLRNRHAGNPDILRRFVEEAQIGGQLQHPGILPVYDLGLRPDGKPYFTMKLIQGRTLAALLEARTDAAKERRDLLSILVSVCQAIAYAHASGVVHRDLKPSNIMVGAFGEVQVLDWGLSKLLARGGVVDDRKSECAAADFVKVAAGDPDSESAQSQTGSVMGTPAYMPPEQARGEVDKLDERTDVFSLGAILCEILTGRPPYSGHSQDSLRSHAAQGKLDPAWSRLDESDADAELVRIAKSCLQPFQRARPRNAGVLAEELSTYMGSVEERLRQAELSRAAAEARAHAEGRARRLTIMLAGSVLVTVLAFGGGWLWMDHAEQVRYRGLATQVEAKLQEAMRLQGRAEGLPAARAVIALEAALVSADDAIELARSDPRGHELAGRARVRHDELATLKAARTNEAKILELQSKLLADLRKVVVFEGAEFSTSRKVTWGLRWSERLDKKYSQTFHRHGVDIDSASPRAVVTQLTGRSSMEFASLLDEWSLALRIVHEKPTERASRRIGIARRLDPDNSLRNELRLLLGQDEIDVPRLVELARDFSPSAESATAAAFIGLFLGLAKQNDEMNRLLTRSHLYHPDDFRLNLWLGLDARIRKPQRLSDAQRHFGMALAQAPDSAGIMGLLGQVLHLDKKYELARQWAKRAVDLSPKSALLRERLARALERVGDLRGAIEQYRECLLLSPDHAGIMRVLGLALDRHGQYAEAIDFFERALKRDPKQAKWHIECSNVLMRLGMNLARQGRAKDATRSHQKAIRSCEACIELGEELAAAYHGVGMARQLLGEFDRAIEAYQESIDVEPEADVYVRLGALYSNKLQKPAEAMKNFKLALALDENVVQAHFNIGVVQSAMGHMEQAKAAFGRATKADPKDVDAHTALAGCMFRSRDYRGAIESSGRALAIDKNDARAKHYLTVATDAQARNDYLLRIVDSKSKAKNPAETAEAATAALYAKRPFDALRLFEQAFADQPALLEDARNFHRYNAVCSAVTAAALPEHPTTAASEPAALREKARGWLRANLGFWRSEFVAGKAAEVHRICVHWLSDSDLTSIRDAKQLASLESDERQRWQAFWKEVRALDTKARAAK